MRNSFDKVGQTSFIAAYCTYDYNGGNGLLNSNNRYNTNQTRVVADSLNLIGDMPRHFLQLFINAYFECRKGKRDTANAFKFEQHWETKLIELAFAVYHQEYIPSRSIAFVITKPRPREIEAASFQDRIVHTFYVNLIGKYVERYLCAEQFACRVGKGSEAAIRKVYDDIYEVSQGYTKQAWIAKLDISGFFTSIDKNILVNKLSQYIIDTEEFEYKYIALYLTRILFQSQPNANCYVKSSPVQMQLIPENKSLLRSKNPDIGLAIGNWHVHIGANFYVADLIKYIKTLEVGRLTNYTDDILIVTDDKDGFLAKLPLIRQFTETELHLHLNDKKFYLQQYWRGVNFLGRTLKSGRIYPSHRIVHNIEERIRIAEILGECSKNHCRSTAKLMVQSLNSSMGLLASCNSYKLRNKLARKIQLSGYGKYMYVNKDKTKWTLKNKLMNYSR